MKFLIPAIFILFCPLAAISQPNILQFSMSLSPAFNNGFTVSHVTATLDGANFSQTKDLTIANSDVNGMFKNLKPGIYTLTIQAYSGSSLITVGSGEGEITSNSITEVKARLVHACGNLILILNWHPNDVIDPNDFYGFSINPENHHLKLYENLTDLDDIAFYYKEDSMNWFNPHRVDELLFSNSRITLDENLVPIVNYSFGTYRNPVTSCIFAFAFYNDFLLSHKAEDKLGFLNNVNWLIDYMDDKYLLHYEFDYNHDGLAFLEEGWISAMAQGMALGAFSMAYFLTSDSSYAKAAADIFSTLYKNTDSLWCVGVDTEDYYWLEEYPNKNFCHVLNGKLSAIWGLWDYYVITGDEFALTLFKAGIRTIADNYPIWNIVGKNASYYCLHHRFKQTYHDLHLLQLDIYADFFDIPEFKDAAFCFSKTEIASVPSYKLLPPQFVVHQNYPNPFNSQTIIEFVLPQRTYISLSIYNSIGQRVDELINEERDAGIYQVTWDAAQLASGIYFYKIVTPDFSVYKKMMLLR